MTPILREASDVRGRVTFLVDDRASCRHLEPVLERWGMASSWHHRADELLSSLDGADLHMVVLDPAPAEMDAIELCLHVRARRPDVRVIVVARGGTFDSAITAMRAGAFDCFVHPIAPAELEDALHRLTRAHSLREHVDRMRLALADSKGFEELVGLSLPMQRLYDLMERAAATSASVLITGDSGTGKELVARALHRRSARKDGPFVAVNCSAIPGNLIESELFGHVKGAFTDAKVARSGLFVKASGGTIFLDEIGDMPMSVQPKLLRALQERSARPVGGDAELSFDVRVIAATHRNLESAVAAKEFREDLFYRINVIHIDIPPLRERGSDVLLLAQHFVDHYAQHIARPVKGISAEAAEKLLAYTWPGNIRELQNCIERAVSLTRHREVQVEDLPAKVASFRRAHLPATGSDPTELVTMEEVERRYIHRVLQAVRGNKREAAKVLGFDRKTLYRKLERYGIEVERAGKA